MMDNRPAISDRPSTVACANNAPLLALHSVASPPRLLPVDLMLDGGECCAVMGASGSGKSLLLRQIADLDPGMGDIELAGVARSALRATDWRRQVAYCQPESGWWADRVDAHFRADSEDARRLVAQLGVRPDAMSSLDYTLSSGERQRLGFARSLLGNPKVLLLDEPTASLDDVATKLVEKVIESRRIAGCAILLVTHSEAQARRLASQCWIMQDGALTKAWG